MITIQEIFKHKETGRKVVYKGLCIYENIKQESDVEGKIYYETYIEDIKDCVLCEDFNTHATYAIPILQFMNYYTPASGYIEDVISTFENIKTLENERHTEDIHTLHSGEPEVDPVAAPEGVQG